MKTIVSFLAGAIIALIVFYMFPVQMVNLLPIPKQEAVFVDQASNVF